MTLSIFQVLTQGVEAEDKEIMTEIHNKLLGISKSKLRGDLIINKTINRGKGK